MQNVLVTGGAGFIGSNFIHYLLGTDPEVKIVTLDALTYAGSLENLAHLPNKAHYEFVKGDIGDQDLVNEILQSYSIDTVVHFAAESHVDRSILGPGAFVQTNIVGTFTLLEACRAFWSKEIAQADPPVRFHHVSTDEVFGSLKPEDPPFNENTPYLPNSPYAASKAASDHLVRAYYHTYGLPITISNCSNNYGPRQFPEKLIPLMILNALEGKPLPVYGDGMQIRDWLYVADHCEAIHKILLEGKPGETYVIGGNNQPANIEIIHEVCRILDERRPDSPFKPHANLIQHVADRPGHDRRYDMDTTKIKRELGWQPRFSLARGLELTIEWYLANPEWVKKIGNLKEFQGWIEKNYGNRREVMG
jgi:dTDP-glucose 4,6-dehydratase